MRYISLIVLAALLSGCLAPDPMRTAIANERTIQANNSQAAQAAQISQSAQADTNARNAQAMLQALQAQQAIVAGQAAIAQADAQTAIVTSNNATLVLVAEQIAEASQPDYTPLYAGMAALLVVVVVWLLVNRRRTAQPVRMLFQTQYACAWQLPDGSIVLRRLADGSERIYLPGEPMYQRLMIGGAG